MADNLLNNKRVAKNTIFLYIRMIVAMLITLYTTKALLKVLGIDDYGVYNVVCGFVTMFSFLNTSLANGVQRFYNYEMGQNGESGVRKIFSHAVIIQLLMAVLIVIVLETFGVWYLNNIMIIPEGRFFAALCIFQFSIIQLILLMLTVPYSAAVMAYEKMDFYAFVSILDSILKLIIVLLLPFASFDKLIYYGALMTLISVVSLILYWLYCKGYLKEIKFSKGFDKTLFKSMLSFSGWNIFGSVAHMLQGQGVNLIFNAFWGTIVNAANGIAHQIVSAVTSLTSGFVTAVRPQMIKSYASGNIGYLQSMYYSVSKLTFFLVMLLAVPLIGEMSPVLNLWLGEGTYPNIAVVLCQLSIFNSLCNSYATPSSIIIHATGRMKKFQLVVSSVIILIIPIAYIAARLGCEPHIILILSILITILAHISRLLIIRKQVNFSIKEYIIKVFLPTWTVFFILISMSCLLQSFTSDSIAFVIIRIFSLVLLSCILIFFLGLNKSEKHLLISLFNKK